MSLGSIFSGGLLGGGIGASLGALNGGGLFGTKQGTVPYTNVSSFNPFAASYLSPAFSGAQNIFNGGNTLLSPAMSTAQKTISGDYLNPESNPFLKSSVQDALGLAGASFAGQYGGAAGTNLGNTGYQEGLARTLGQVATNAYSNAYQQERQNQLSAIPFAASLPYANVTGYESALSPGLGFGTTTTQGQQPYYQNNTAQTLGALIGGGALMKGIGGGALMKGFF